MKHSQIHERSLIDSLCLSLTNADDDKRVKSCELTKVDILRSLQQRSCDGREGGAKRPILCINEPKITGARSVAKTPYSLREGKKIFGKHESYEKKTIRYLIHDIRIILESP